jgi:hypothetical protein
MKFIITPNPNPPHNLLRICPAYQGREFSHWSEAQVIQHVIDRNKQVGVIASGAPYYVVDESDLPGGAVTRENDYFFACWEWDGARCVVNMDKARAIHLTEIRKVRNVELAKKDITFMRAVESGDTSAQSTIATERQTLRDIPQTFDLTTDTSEQLKAKWPTELPARE